PLRGTILAGSAPSCAHDDDRLRFPPTSPARNSKTGKKESTGRRLNRPCPPCATPFSNFSLDYRRSDARIVENGFAASSGMSKSAKVVLGRVRINPLSVSGARHQKRPSFGPVVRRPRVHHLRRWSRRTGPRGQAALNGAALRISYGLLCRHLHRNIGRGCHEWIFLIAASAFCRWRSSGNRMPKKI